METKNNTIVESNTVASSVNAGTIVPVKIKSHSKPQLQSKSETELKILMKVAKIDKDAANVNRIFNKPKAIDMLIATYAANDMKPAPTKEVKPEIKEITTDIEILQAANKANELTNDLPEGTVINETKNKGSIVSTIGNDDKPIIEATKPEIKKARLTTASEKFAWLKSQPVEVLQQIKIKKFSMLTVKEVVFCKANASRECSKEIYSGTKDFNLRKKSGSDLVEFIFYSTYNKGGEEKQSPRLVCGYDSAQLSDKNNTNFEAIFDKHNIAELPGEA